MSGQRRELVYIYRAPPLALAGLDALAGSVLLFRPIGFRVARYLPGRRSGFRQHALADQHFVRNPECIAWVTGQSEISVVEETGVSRTSSRFYAGSGTIPIQNMVLSRTSMSVYACQTFSASLRRVACQFGYRRCGRVARRRQVAEAVGSSSHLTRRWRELDSNFQLRATPSALSLSPRRLLACSGI